MSPTPETDHLAAITAAQRQRALVIDHGLPAEVADIAFADVHRYELAVRQAARVAEIRAFTTALTTPMPQGDHQ